MKKKIILISIAYYILFLLFYMVFAYLSVKLMKTDNLAAAVVRAGFLVFILTPGIVLVFARFSLLRWYVDPIVAAIVPLFFYFGMVINQLKNINTWGKAFSMINWTLSEDGGTGWGFLIALFLFGLLASFSPARKAGRSISYRIIDKITAK